MKADRTLLIVGKYYLLSAVVLVGGVAVAAAGVVVAPGDILAVLAPLLDGDVSGFLDAGTGAYLLVLGVVVAVVGRTAALVYTVGSGLEAGLEERAEAIERDLNRELRALRADLTGGGEARARDRSRGPASTGAGTGTDGDAGTRAGGEDRPPTGVDGESSG